MAMLPMTLAVLLPMPIVVSPASPDLAEAILRARKLPEAARRIVVRPGRYEIAKTLELGPEDRGLRIEGERGARLIGGRVLSGGRTSGRMVRYSVSDASLPRLTARGFGLPTLPMAPELFLDGKPARLARYPDAGKWLKVSGAKDGSFTTDDPVPFAWAKSEDLFVHGYWQFDWADVYQPATLDAASRRIQVPRLGSYGAPKDARRFAFLNVREAMDAPGEYVLDRSQGMVEAIPFDGKPPSEAILSLLDGPILHARKAERLVIRGLTVETGRAEGIVLEGGLENRVAEVTVRNMGTHGIVVRNETGTVIDRVDCRNTGETGLVLAGGDRATLVPGGNVVQDSTFVGSSRICRTYRPGVLVEGVGNVVRHCRITDLPHTAILMSGNDHVIEGNEIARVCRETGDAGAIYMGRDPTMRGVVLRRNFLHQIDPLVSTEGAYVGVMALYLDDCFGGVLVEGNVVVSTGEGLKIGGGHDNVVRGNAFVNCRPGIGFDGRGLGWAKGLFVRGGEWRFLEKLDEMKVKQPPYSVRYPRLIDYEQRSPARPQGNRSERNLVLCEKPVEYLDGLTPADLPGEGNTFGPAPGARWEAALKEAGFRFTRRQFGPRS